MAVLLAEGHNSSKPTQSDSTSFEEVSKGNGSLAREISHSKYQAYDTPAFRRLNQRWIEHSRNSACKDIEDLFGRHGSGELRGRVNMPYTEGLDEIFRVGEGGLGPRILAVRYPLHHIVILIVGCSISVRYQVLGNQ